MISPAMVDFLMQAGLTTRTMTWKAKKQQVRFVTWTRKAIFQYMEIAERMEKSRFDLILAGRELLREILTVLKLVPFAFYWVNNKTQSIENHVFEILFIYEFFFRQCICLEVKLSSLRELIRLEKQHRQNYWKKNWGANV